MSEVASSDWAAEPREQALGQPVQQELPGPPPESGPDERDDESADADEGADVLGNETAGRTTS